MKTVKFIWNSLVGLAILFLLFMFGINYFGPMPQLSSIPKPPSLPVITLKPPAEKSFSNTLFNPKSLTNMTQHAIFQAKSNAIAWVVEIKVESASTETLIKKLQSQKWVSFAAPLAERQKVNSIFVGPFVHRQEAEQAALAMKQSFGLAGDVVKFDPLTM